jgi:hypothetical protein
MVAELAEVRTGLVPHYFRLKSQLGRPNFKYSGDDRSDSRGEVDFWGYSCVGSRDFCRSFACRPVRFWPGISTEQGVPSKRDDSGAENSSPSCLTGQLGSDRVKKCPQIEKMSGIDRDSHVFDFTISRKLWSARKGFSLRVYREKTILDMISRVIGVVWCVRS